MNERFILVLLADKDLVLGSGVDVKKLEALSEREELKIKGRVTFSSPAGEDTGQVVIMRREYLDDSYLVALHVNEREIVGMGFGNGTSSYSARQVIEVLGLSCYTYAKE